MARGGGKVFAPPPVMAPKQALAERRPVFGASRIAWSSAKVQPPLFNVHNPIPAATSGRPTRSRVFRVGIPFSSQPRAW